MPFTCTLARATHAPLYLEKVRFGSRQTALFAQHSTSMGPRRLCDKRSVHRAQAHTQKVVVIDLVVHTLSCVYAMLKKHISIELYIEIE